MSRLADEIQRTKLTPPLWANDPQNPEHNSGVMEQTRVFQEYARQAIRDGLVVVADNVAEYFYAGNDQEEWDLNRDYPSLAPPFERFFVEWRRPSKVVSRECGIRTVEGSALAWGCLCAARPVVELTDVAFAVYAAGETGERQLSLDEMKTRTHWWLELTTLAEMTRHRYWGPLATFTMLLDDQGLLLGRHTVQHLNWVSESPPPDHFIEWLSSPLFCLGMVLSFFHCKNVALKEHQPPPSLSRAHQKRHGRPLSRYHVLEIEPMKQVLRTEGQSETTGLKKALHICRGHFADYREGRGLFGRYHGRYWVPMHARGAIKEGIVAKDYAMKAPR